MQIDFEISGTWKEEGATLTQDYTFEGETFKDVATFSIVGDVLTLDYEEDEVTYGYQKL